MRDFNIGDKVRIIAGPNLSRAYSEYWGVGTVIRVGKRVTVDFGRRGSPRHYYKNNLKLVDGAAMSGEDKSDG